MPRAQNIEADELSNLVTARFDPKLRIPIQLEEVRFHCLTELLEYGTALYADLTTKRKLKKEVSEEKLPLPHREVLWGITLPGPGEEEARASIPQEMADKYVKRLRAWR